LYYRFAGDACVDSSIMALKNKGEGEGSVAYQGTCCADEGVQHIVDYVHSFRGPKAPYLGGMI